MQAGKTVVQPRQCPVLTLEIGEGIQHNKADAGRRIGPYLVNREIQIERNCNRVVQDDGVACGVQQQPVFVQQIYAERCGQCRLKHEDVEEYDNRRQPVRKEQLLKMLDKMSFDSEHKACEVGRQMQFLLDLQLILIQGQNGEHAGDKKNQLVGMQHFLAEIGQRDEWVTPGSQADQHNYERYGKQADGIHGLVKQRIRSLLECGK
ncbi:hypothetical protein D3C71_1427990 [compost metagenome]